MDALFTAAELQQWLRAHFPTENERHEWKEWRSLKSNISGRKGSDLVTYISALANMEGGCIVIGAQDGTLAPTGIQDFADYTAENLLHRVLSKTPGLPSMGLHVQELRATDTGAVVWLDRVQKKLPIADPQAAALRRAQLIEGRKPNYFVSAHVADATNTRAQYTRNKGLSDHYYKTLILQHIQKFGSASAAELRTLLLDKLPDSLTAQQKGVKIKNLLAALRSSGLDGVRIGVTGAGKNARWVIR